MSERADRGHAGDVQVGFSTLEQAVSIPVGVTKVQVVLTGFALRTSPPPERSPSPTPGRSSDADGDGRELRSDGDDHDNDGDDD